MVQRAALGPQEFSASSRLFGLNGKVKTAGAKQRSANMVC